MVVVSRYSTRVSNLIANQSVQVLATLVQLSFAKLLSTVTTIFVSANIRVSLFQVLRAGPCGITMEALGIWKVLT